jgi:hypothetical protein
MSRKFKLTKAVLASIPELVAYGLSRSEISVLAASSRR